MKGDTARTPRKAPPRDKRVYDLRVSIAGTSDERWRLVAVSADALLHEVVWALQGAFEEREATGCDIAIGTMQYATEAQSRIAARDLLHMGTVMTCRDFRDGCAASAEVVNEYTVATRRHYPKVLGGGESASESWDPGSWSLQVATWCAQDAASGFGLEKQHRAKFPPPTAGGPTQDMIDALDELLASRTGVIPSASAAHGFFTAIVSGPLVMPGDWLPLVLGNLPQQSIDRFEAGLATIMTFYTAVAASLAEAPESFAIVVDEVPGTKRPRWSARAWCAGYLVAAELRHEAWYPIREDPELATALETFALIANLENDDIPAATQLTELLAPASLLIYEEFRSGTRARARQTPVRRAAPKISPNAPCPCGSGRKFKRCCAT